MPHRVTIFRPLRRDRFSPGPSLPREAWLYSDGTVVAVRSPDSAFSKISTLHEDLDDFMEHYELQPSDLFRLDSPSPEPRHVDRHIIEWLRWALEDTSPVEKLREGASDPLIARLEWQALSCLRVEDHPDYQDAVEATLDPRFFRADPNFYYIKEENALAALFLQVHLCALWCTATMGEDHPDYKSAIEAMRGLHPTDQAPNSIFHIRSGSTVSG
jgi:hypothetical protein